MKFTITTDDRDEFNRYFYGPQLSDIILQLNEWLRVERKHGDLTDEEKTYNQKVARKLYELRDGAIRGDLD